MATYSVCRWSQVPFLASPVKRIAGNTKSLPTGTLQGHCQPSTQHWLDRPELQLDARQLLMFAHLVTAGLTTLDEHEENQPNSPNLLTKKAFLGALLKVPLSFLKWAKCLISQSPWPHFMMHHRYERLISRTEADHFPSPGTHSWPCCSESVPPASLQRCC